MKRYIGALIVVMSWAVCAEAASLSFSTDPLIGAPGNTIPTSVVYSPQGALVAGLQFTVIYEPIALSLSSALTGNAATLAGKDTTFLTVSPGVTNFLTFGLNSNIIGDGSLADLTFQVNLNAPAGPYNLYLSGLLGSDATGNPVAIANLNPAPNGSVPIPSTFWPLGLGLLGLWFLRIRTY
jgi:hypothetical protein